MTILVINSGSSSLKVSLFKNCERVVDAQVKGLNSENASLEIDNSSKKINGQISLPDALHLILNELNVHDIIAVGHRYVHGGNKHVQSTLLNDTVLKDLEKISYLAPLHNAICL